MKVHTGTHQCMLRESSVMREAPIGNCTQNSVENLSGDIAKLPVNWTQVVEINTTKEWPLFFSLAIERIVRESLAIPATAFQFREHRILVKRNNG